ncbi:MAG: hypothetical protein KDA37_17510, partial [Planctomycetales bacterium]|nr:hypothetical protein [Planctomycetales bacterium]
AQHLAEVVRRTQGLSLVGARCDTNLVIFELAAPLGTADAFQTRLEAEGVLTFAVSKQRVRAVTHRDVSLAEVQTAAGVIEQLALASGGRP